MMDTAVTGNHFSLTTRAIKWIALISMFCDHFAKVLLISLINHSWENPAVTGWFHQEWVIRFYYALPCFGRLAFPLFIFLLVEGFFLTRNRWKYLRNILIFAVVSEIPFDMGFRMNNLIPASGRLIESSYQNVLFTLAIGLFAMILIDLILSKYPTGSPAAVVAVLIAVGAIWLGNMLETDYHGYGVTAILIAYFIRRKGTMRLAARQTAATPGTKIIPSVISQKITPLPLGWRVLEMILLIIPLIILSTSEVWALIDVGIIALYSGKRGKNMHKWFFYVFYPAHLAVLVLLRTVFLMQG